MCDLSQEQVERLSLREGDEVASPQERVRKIGAR